jgi:hypothetical protein
MKLVHLGLSLEYPPLLYPLARPRFLWRPQILTRTSSLTQAYRSRCSAFSHSSSLLLER